MNYNQQPARQQLHTRTIICEAFERNDGLIDIEGTLRDIKFLPFVLPERGLVNPGEAIHQMKLVITIDRGFVINDARAMTLDSPYSICGAINDSYRQIIGLQIAPGFTNQVKQLFRGVAGCSHMTELLPPMATTAFQVVWSSKEEFSDVKPGDDPSKRTTPLGGCHALRQDGEVVRIHFPKHFQSSIKLKESI